MKAQIVDQRIVDHEGPVVPISDSVLKKISARLHKSPPYINWVLRSQMGRDVDAWMFQADQDLQALMAGFRFEKLNCAERIKELEAVVAKSNEDLERVLRLLGEELLSDDQGNNSNRE